MIWGLPNPIQVEIFQSDNGGVSSVGAAVGDIFYISDSVRQIGNFLYIEILKYGLTTASQQVATYQPPRGALWFVRLNKEREITYYSTQRENGRLTVGQLKRERLDEIRPTGAAQPEKDYKDLSDEQLKALVAVGDGKAQAELVKRGKERGSEETEAGAGFLPPTPFNIPVTPFKFDDWWTNLLIAGIILLLATGVAASDRD